ncbi:MAG: signal peptide peptidase SppA [Candidatus Saganbacteria bacterium]|nr:signal peptide peptidase SppA [Candidatus Saganbacteria bacterium]
MTRLNYKIVLLFSIFYCLFSTIAYSQDLTDRAMRRGIGTRSAGMGGVGTAVADDGSAVFYNPANLAEPGFCYMVGDPDAEQRGVNGSMELLKLGYIGYGAWKMQETTGDEIKTTAIGFGNRSGWLNWGMTYKDMSWNLSGVPASGWATDIGFLMRVTPQLEVGLLGQDLFTSKESLVPAAGRLGIAFRPIGDRLLFAGDVELNRSGQSFGHLGVEAIVTQGLTFRGGVDRGEPTAGLTLDLALFSFEYAARFNEAGQSTNCFEMGLKVLPSRARPFSLIKPKEFALIDVSGALKGGRDEYSFLGGYRPGVDSIIQQIRRAAKDSSIDGIMLRIGGFGSGFGSMAIVQEIRAELKRAKAKGKKIIAYVEGSAVGEEYYLAAVADKIIAPPGSAIGGFGKSFEILRIGGAYEKIGIEWQVFKQGAYKDSLDPYRDEFTPEQKQLFEGLVADLYRQMLTDIAADRNIPLPKMKEIGDGMIFPAKLAYQMGLIDEIGYTKDARVSAAALYGAEGEEAKIVQPNLVQPEEAFLARVFGIAVIEIDGEIVSGSGGENIIFGGRYVGSEKIAAYIRKASDDVFIKAIVLRIDSPGGDAIASGEIYEAIKYAKEKDKKVIASIGSMGASGGYYIAAAADKIVADPASITGSIGVIGYMPVYKELLKKLDSRADVIKEGEHSDMFSGLRDLTTVEVFAVERLQKEGYDEFIQAVADGRGMPTAEVRAAAEGQLFTGSQAKELGLVDELGGFSDAVDLAVSEAKIIGEPRLVFYHEPSYFFSFSEGMVESLGFKALPHLLPGHN